MHKEPPPRLLPLHPKSTPTEPEQFDPEATIPISEVLMTVLRQLHATRDDILEALQRDYPNATYRELSVYSLLEQVHRMAQADVNHSVLQASEALYAIAIISIWLLERMEEDAARAYEAERQRMIAIKAASIREEMKRLHGWGRDAI